MPIVTPRNTRPVALDPPRRDPPDRLPAGTGLALAVILGTTFWIVGLGLVFL